MSRLTMKDTESQGSRRSSAIARDAELGPISVGLSVAAIEFAACGAILLALVAFGVVSTTTAVTWAGVILVPLSATISFLGLRVGILSRRLAPRDHGISRGELPQVA